MRRNSVLIPSGKESKNQKKHAFSALLENDHRVGGAPRHLEVVHQLKTPSRDLIFMAKIYMVLDTPGSELLTLSCVDSKNGSEVEMRFDEKFPVSIHFRKNSDEQRVAYVRTHIELAGGFEKILEAFRSKFPKFGI